MRITNRDRSNLARFGCSLSVKQKQILVLWPRERQDHAASANIAVQSIRTTHTVGPLLSLALEISLKKILPHYCFFPFDLNKREHRNYLSNVCKNGEIRLCFLAGSRQIARKHIIPQRRLDKFNEEYEATVRDAKEFPTDKYDFERAVTDLEQGIRLVDSFEYVVSPTDLQRLADLSKAQAAKLLPEDRAQAARITSDLLEVFRKRYDPYIREQIKQLSVIRRGFLLFSDLQREFEGDYAAFAHFVTDLIAANPGYRDLDKLTPLFDAVFTLLDQMRNAPSEADDASHAQLETGLREIADAVTSGLGLPIGLLKDILSTFGIQFRRPGRTPEDYSSEYGLKAKGLSWPAVTEHALENNLDTRREFGGRQYDELTLGEKERLENRIRQGVRSYAERTGKPWPLQQDSKLLPPPDEGQTKSP